MTTPTPPLPPVAESDRKVLAWFSAGAPSAVAARMAVHEFGPDRVTIINTDVGSEHPDNARFIRDVSDWIGLPIESIKSPKYSTPQEVWRARRYLVGPDGALCTTELKKKPRWAVQDQFGAQVYGYCVDPKDAKRAVRFRQQNPEVTLLTPLIERGLTKADCLGIIQNAGIAIPAMYLLGYRNNNCIGCVKGGMGYWNKIRRDFPDTFTEMATLERELDATVLHNEAEGSIFLDTLDPERGNYAEEVDIDCSLLCDSVESEWTTQRDSAAPLSDDPAQQESS